MPIDLGQLKKLEASSLPASPSREAEAPVELIVKVRKPNYVPLGLTVRARIDPHLFTAEALASMLPQLELDPAVVSVALGKRLRMIG